MYGIGSTIIKGVARSIVQNNKGRRYSEYARGEVDGLTSEGHKKLGNLGIGGTEEPIIGTRYSGYAIGEVDGSTSEGHKKLGNLGIGGILMDQTAEPIIGFTMRAGYGDIQIAEGTGIVRLMEFSLAQGIRKLIIRSDRENMVNFLSRAKKIRSRHHLSKRVLQRHDILVPQFDDFRLEHLEKDDKNDKGISHYLATMGKTQNKIIRCLEDIDDEIMRLKIAKLIEAEKRKRMPRRMSSNDTQGTYGSLLK